MKALKNKKILIPAILVIICLVIGVTAFSMYTAKLKAPSTTPEKVIFEVKEGEGNASVLDKLEKAGLIQDIQAAKLCMKLQGLNDIKFGVFTLDRSWDTETILENLNDVKKAKQNEVMITFKEGMWAKDIAQSLQHKLGVNAKNLLKLWNDDTYLKELMKTYPFLTKDILNDKTRVKLEGYLFPETYTFAKDADEKEITKTFLDHFQKIYQKYEKDIVSSKFTMHEILTLASMVQYEASTKEDMQLIAGVFFNRLDKDMMLQSSVTVCYALYDDLTSGEDCEVNPDIDSLYNTYKYKGLPIGPILNPGEDAIQAVLHPTKSDYLYFVADVYGDGKVHYAKSYEEQLQNQEKFHLNK